MGIILDQIDEGIKNLVNTGTECKDCNKAVAGMESVVNPDASLSNRGEGGNDTAVVKKTDGKEFTLMGAPISAMFTSALDVKFANNQNNEASTERPVAGVGNESAAQDTMIAAQLMQSGGVSSENTVSRMTTRVSIGRSHRFKQTPTNLTVSQALKQISDNIDDVDFVFVGEQRADGNMTGRLDLIPMESAIEGRKSGVGVVPGIQINPPKYGPMPTSCNVPVVALEAISEGIKTSGLKVSKVEVIVHYQQP